MIHSDTAAAAGAMVAAIEIADDLDQLQRELPDVVVLLSWGLVMALRELQLHALDVELHES